MTWISVASAHAKRTFYPTMKMTNPISWNKDMKITSCTRLDIIPTPCYCSFLAPLSLTANSCLMSMSEAFSDMLPTNTVVVGPLSSLSLARTAARSFLGIGGLLTTDTEGTITVGVGVMMPTWTGIIGVPAGAKENAHQTETRHDWEADGNGQERNLWASVSDTEVTKAVLHIQFGTGGCLPDANPANWGGIPGGGNKGRFKWGGKDMVAVNRTNLRKEQWQVLLYLGIMWWHYTVIDNTKQRWLKIRHSFQINVYIRKKCGQMRPCSVRW